MSSDFDTTVLNNIHSARGEFYTFLAKFFENVPDAGFYQLLSHMSPKLSAIMSSTDNEDIIKGSEGIIKFITKRNSLSGNDLSAFELEVSRNYTTMFCLTRSIPLDESIYTSSEHREKMDSYDRMKRLFKKYDIKKTGKLAENEDFISYEFLFMSKLSYKCCELIALTDMDTYKSCLQAQLNFHIDHFDKWLGELFYKILNYGLRDEELYKYFAYFAKGFIAEDKRTLSEFIDN